MGKVDYESEIFLIQRYITLWKGTTASVDIISLSSKLFHDSCFKPAERRKYFFRYSVYVGENSFDLKQVAIISAETCQMVLNLILASICIEKNWGDEKILVIPVTWQISAQPLGRAPVSHGELNMPCSQIYGRGKGGSKHFLQYSLRYFFMIFFNIASDILYNFYKIPSNMRWQTWCPYLREKVNVFL